MRAFIAVLIHLLVFSLPASAKGPEDLIPVDAGFVLLINSEKLGENLGEKGISRFSYIEKMLLNISSDSSSERKKILKEVIRSPRKAGIDNEQNMYGYFHVGDSIGTGGLVMALDDDDKFQKFLKEVIISQYEDRSVGKIGRYQWFKADDLNILWDKNFVQFLAVDEMSDAGNNAPYYNEFNYLDEDLSEEEIQAQLAQNKQRKEQITESTLEYITGKAKSLSRKNRNFKKILDEDYDIAVWTDMERFFRYFNAIGQGPMKSSALQPFMLGMQSLYESNYIHFLGKFFNDKIEVKMNSYYPEEHSELYTGIYNNQVSGRLNQYIKGDSAMMVYGLSFNPKTSFNSAVSTYKKIFSRNEAEGKQILAIIDLVNIVIDFDRLLEIPEGDFLFAFTGTRPVKTTYIEYEYDDEFNRIEKEAVKTEHSPVYTMAMEIQNSEDMKTILQSFERLEILEYHSDGYYRVEVNSPWEKEKKYVYLSLSDGVFIVTNDQYLADKKFKKGYTEDQQLSPELQGQLSQNGVVMYMDFDYVLRNIEKTMDQETDSIDLVALSDLREKVESFSFTGMEVADGISSGNMTLHLKENSEGSLVSLLQLTDLLLRNQERKSVISREAYARPETYEVEEADDYQEYEEYEPAEGISD